MNRLHIYISKLTDEYSQYHLFTTDQDDNEFQFDFCCTDATLDKCFNYGVSALKRAMNG